MMLQQESQKDALERKIAARQARVGIMGLGYAGLPMAVEIANAGFHVTGFDVSLDRVSSIQRGESPVSDVPSETITWLVNEEMLSATSDFDALAEQNRQLKDLAGERDALELEWLEAVEVLGE